MQYVFVVDKNKKPLMPCHPARARQLLKEKKAVVFKYRPFTIRLVERENGDTQPTSIKLDPGYGTTGIALVVTGKNAQRAVWAAELTHRGQVVVAKMISRRQIRRGRRTRKLRYRSPRFLNRRNKYNKVTRWLPPSMHSRMDNISCWLNRLQRYVPVTSVSCETTKFDTQQMQNPEIDGKEYQKGELYGYEVWQYLLEKWDRKCAYCGVQGVPLEREHITPKSRGGSNRVSNLTLSCHECNQKKGNKTAEEFGYPEIQKKAKQSLKSAAAMTATRWEIWERLCETGLDLECGTGGMTAYNRALQSYQKEHWIDAVCVGKSGQNVLIPSGLSPLLIKAMGRGSRQICATDKYGFPIRYRARTRQNNGFRTGDLVLAKPQKGKLAGKSFIARCTSNASTKSLWFSGIGKNCFITHRYCTMLQRSDGYDYSV